MHAANGLLAAFAAAEKMLEHFEQVRDKEKNLVQAKREKCQIDAHARWERIVWEESVELANDLFVLQEQSCQQFGRNIGTEARNVVQTSEGWHILLGFGGGSLRRGRRQTCRAIRRSAGGGRRGGGRVGVEGIRHRAIIVSLVSLVSLVAIAIGIVFRAMTGREVRRRSGSLVASAPSLLVVAHFDFK